MARTHRNPTFSAEMFDPLSEKREARESVIVITLTSDERFAASKANIVGKSGGLR